MDIMLVITVPLDQSDVAAAALWGRGVRAIEERAPIPAGEAGSVELWTSIGDLEATEQALAALSTRWPGRVERVDHVPAETWRDHAAPMWVGERLVVVPAWQEHDVGHDVTVVPIEPGGAFGLGDHPTTRLCLTAVLAADLNDARVLDVGCGTGVLSVVAALQGASLVRSIDVSAAAVAATNDNAERNGVGDRIAADDTAVHLLGGRYDLVLANILAPELIAMAEALQRLTAPEGRLVVSGVLAGAHGHVLAALAPMVVVSTDTLDGWAAVTLTHPG